MEEAIQKIRELMAAVAPDIDTSPGSPFDAVVLGFIEDNFGVGDLELDLEDMIIRRIQQLDPDIDTDVGSPIYEFLIKVLPAIMQVPRLEVQRIKSNQDLNNFENMTEVEVDRRVSNFFIQRQEGDVSIGTVRAFFANPVPVSTNLTNRAFTSSGLAFFPDGAFTASRNRIAQNKEGNLFFVDIPYVSEASGDQYNIGPDEIVGVENMPGLVRATNVDAFVGGVPRETNEALLNRVQKSLAERSLSSANSTITILTEQFPTKVLGVTPIGFGQPEMERDKFLFQPSVSKDGIFTLVFDGSSQFPLTNAAGKFELPFDDVDPISVRVFNGFSADGLSSEIFEGAGYEFENDAGPNGNDQINLTAGSLGALTISFNRISAQVNLIRTIPGSIEVPPLFPSPDQPQTISVGGKADVYIKPSTEEADFITISSLDRFTVFKADDGIITEDVGLSQWFFETSRGLTLGEVGARPGDILEVVTLDNFGNPVVQDVDTFVIADLDFENRRFRLESTGNSVFQELSNVDVRVRLREDRAIPLERLVATDNFEDEIFLDQSDSDTGRAVDFDPSSNLPLSPSLGFLNRDSSLPDFVRNIQERLPMVTTRESTNFAFRRSDVRYDVGQESFGLVRYFVQEENIASGSLNTPWTRLTDVTVLNPLSLNTIEDQKVRNIYPADVRSLDLSGGIDSDATNPGVEASGKLRIYFEHPLTLLMYGPNYGDPDPDFDGHTRFTHRVTKEVIPGVDVTFNLKYRLQTHGPAAGPAILVRAEDFTEDNGLWYFDVFVRGDTPASTRSDQNPVVESDLNLGDEQVVYIGDLTEESPLRHIIDELEFEFAGEPQPKTIGEEAIAEETPIDSEHAYIQFTGTWSGNEFAITNNPFLITSEVEIGDFVNILEKRPLAYIEDLTEAEIPIAPDNNKLIGRTISSVNSVNVTVNPGGSSPDVLEDTNGGGPFTAANVGQYVVISNSTNPSNDGTFRIVTLLSPTQVQLVDSADAPAAFVTESGGGTLLYEVRPDFVAEGVEVGDIVEGLSSQVFVQGFEQDEAPNDTVLLTSTVTAGTVLATVDFHKWDIASDHEILEVIDEGTLRLSDPSTGSAQRFVIISQNGDFRLKNPHIRKGNNPLTEGTPGNEGNRGFRAEGYYFDARNPYDRLLPDNQYTYSIQEFTLFRYTEGIDTRYFPNAAPVGSELSLAPSGGEVSGRGRDNFTFFSGLRVPVSGPDFEFAVGPALITKESFLGAGASSALTGFGINGGDSADSRHMRVFVGNKELRQIAYDNSAGSTINARTDADDVYMFSQDPDTVYVSSENGNLDGDTGVLGGSSGVGGNFIINDDHVATFGPGVEFEVYGSTGGDKDGVYTVASTELLSGPTRTQINVVEEVPSAGVFDGDLALRIRVRYLTLLNSIVLTDGPENLILDNGSLEVDYPLPAPAEDVIRFINDNAAIFFAVLGEDDSTGTVLEGTYARSSAPRLELNENFLSRRLRRQSIQIDYEWSRSTREVHDFATATDTRSLNQDILIRHGIPIFANVDLVVNSQFVVGTALLNDIRSFILSLDQQALRTSDIIRLPTIAEHVPLPVSINGLVLQEDRRFRTIRDQDGIESARIEAILPGQLNVTVNAQ